jgi:proteasome lid subunit RPN8/RPN11
MSAPNADSRCRPASARTNASIDGPVACIEMLQAVRNLVVRYGAEEIRLFAGRSRVAEDHPIAKANPESFRTVPGSGRGARTRILGVGTANMVPAPVVTTSPRADYGREPWRILLGNQFCRTSDRPSRVRVRLAAPARAQLMENVERTTGLDELESGGMCFGPPMRDGLLEVIGVSSGAGERGRDFYKPNLSHDARLVAEAERSGLVQVGDWHSHPSSYRAPSQQDLLAYVGQRGLNQQDAHLALIAVRGDTSWELQAWIVRASGAGGRDVAEPAIIW